MLFNLIQFLIFFIVVTSLYFKYRWVLLLISSCYFYMAYVPIYILILGFIIVIDYFVGIYLKKIQGKKKKWFLSASLVGNIGVWDIFKYYNFFNDNLTLFLNGLGVKNSIPYLSILLPIGLSFHTIFLNRDKINEDIKQFSKESKYYERAIFQIHYLRKIVDLCKQKSVRLILINTPKNEYYLNKLNVSLIRDWNNVPQNHQNITILDFSTFSILDSCFGDLTHLNYKGARIFSNYLNKHISIN